MKDIIGYQALFTNLHTATVRGMKAPHKAILLLSVMELVERHVINTPYIALSDELINCFKANWQHYVVSTSPFTADIGKPFFHLQHEPFWTLIEKEKSLEPVSSDKVNYSIESLRSKYHGALINESLFGLLQDPDARIKLRVALISKYMPSNQDDRNGLLKSLGAAIVSLMAIAI